MSSFSSLRTTFRAILISSLLIFGHILLTTAASCPPQALDLSPADTDTLTSGFKQTSALTFLTLLWVAFTLLEHSELVSSTEGQGSHGFFSRTWVEFGLNALALESWTAFRAGTFAVLNAYSPDLATELVLLPITYAVVIASLCVLQTQLILSIATHTWTTSTSDLFTTAFWAGRTGWWESGIALDDDVEAGIDGCEKV